MTRQQRSPSRRFSVVVGQLPFVVAGIGALVAAWAGRITLAAAVTVFAGCVLGSVLLAAWSMRSYECPDCRMKLLPPRGWWHRFPGTPILFRCTRCDTDWDFGLKGPED